MKLIGSITEEDYRRDLKAGQRFFLEERRGRELFARIKAKFPKLKTVSLLHWVPEQGEDVYEILIDDEAVLKVEVPHSFGHSDELDFDYIKLKNYVHGLSRSSQIKLAVALDLARAWPDVEMP
jgi:hypothetical protein